MIYAAIAVSIISILLGGWLTILALFWYGNTVLFWRAFLMCTPPSYKKAMRIAILIHDWHVQKELKEDD